MKELQGSSDGNRVEFRPVESTSMQAFQSVSEQEMTVETVIEWFDQSFQKISSVETRTPEPSSSAPARGA